MRRGGRAWQPGGQHRAGGGLAAGLLAAGRRAGRGRGGLAAGRRASGSRSPAAAPPGSWRSPTRRPGRQAGQGETDAFAASEMPLGRRYDRVLVLSRSGTTTEILQLLDRLPGHRAHRRDHRRRGDPGGAGRRRRSSSWTSRTRSRWCRPGSPPPSWPCCARTSGRTSARRPRRRSGCWPSRCPPSCWRPASSPSSAPAGPAGWPTRPRSSCARRPGCGPRPTRRWSTGTARPR